jgi:hypothetical protein
VYEVNGKAAQFEDQEQYQGNWNVFGEIGVSAYRALERSIAAVAEAHPGAAPMMYDPQTENEQPDCE